jgi:hypothetical protein
VPGLVLDHLVLGAANLDQGVAHLREILGIELPFGGAHPRMGTHNCLTRIGDDVFLEIIAIDPEAEAPGRPRWFGLDDPARQQQLAERPRLIAWVAGTHDIESALRAAPIDLGSPVEMTRGDLAWRIGIRDDGAVPEGGVLPCLIQWPTGPHPSRNMADLGLRLESLRLGHPDPDRIRAALGSIDGAGLAELAAAAAPSIAADLRRPDGRLVTLA